MDFIRLKNLRSLADTDWAEILPITLLLGQNSSGKSTLLRSFPLLRQSVEARSTGPILWYGDLVDFGSFSDALNKASDEKTISFAFDSKISHPRKGRARQFGSPLSPSTFPIIGNPSIKSEITLHESSKDGSTTTKSAKFEFAGHLISIDIDDDDNIQYFNVNKTNILKYCSAEYRIWSNSKILPNILPQATSDNFILRNESRLIGLGANPKVLNELMTITSSLMHGNVSIETIFRTICDFKLGAAEDMLSHMRQLEGGTYWHKNMQGMACEHPFFQSLQDLIIALRMPEVIEIVDDSLVNFARNVSYITPVRANAERYYRPQGLAVDTVDSDGKNLAMFLRSLTEAERKSFRTWVSDHFGFYINPRSSGGHISLHVVDITEGATGQEFNLADTGFGLTQILPVIAQLWVLTHRNQKSKSLARIPLTLAIEQPELHLHPRLQARVAELFMDAVHLARKVNIDLRLIIETHSETIVNTIGEKIYRGQYKKEDVNVILFDKDINNQTILRLSEYNGEGILLNWPSGFFNTAII